MEFHVSDEMLGTVAPIVVYWLYSGFYMLFESLENYRLHSKQDEDCKNLVPKRTVVKGVLLQQALQAVVAIILFTVTGNDADDAAANSKGHSLVDIVRQFFTTIKTVDDHCGLWLPGNLFHVFFRNNSAYHDVHHQLYGAKYNFSQPFFITWDKILGTYMPYTLENRAGGGYEVKPTKADKDD